VDPLFLGGQSVNSSSVGESRLARIPRWLRACGVLFLLSIWAAALGYPMLMRALGGAWHAAPADWVDDLSPRTQEVLERAIEDLDPDRLVDVHAHIAGIGSDGSGCWVHPRMRSWTSPLEYLRFQLYLSASGVDGERHADREFVARLRELIAGDVAGGRICLLAFDHAYREDGTLDLENSAFYVPNQYIWDVAAIDRERLIPVISVHPYREDALEELELWAGVGVRLVKWLPNAMGIDPASERCDAFYDKLRELDMTLLSHTGIELAVHAEDRQEFGNPLRLRRALDHGVRVIAAHCATLGENLDLDAGGNVQVSSFELFMRMMDEARYEGLLFGELSAVTLANRSKEVLQELIERKDLHPRLVNGSDYPLPAMNAVIHLGPFVSAGLLSEEEEDALVELYEAHPLAFDLALKRLLRSPRTGEGFDPEAFLVPASLGL